MSTEYVSLKSLSKELGMDRSHARRYVLGLGINPIKKRMSDSANQLSLAVTEEEAQKIRDHRKAKGYDGSVPTIETENGFFYVIALVPDLDHRRIKLGFANNVVDRLFQHRTAAPTAHIITHWPCKRSWEKVVIECLTAKSCKHILNEVFECSDIDSLAATGDRLFKILPKV